MRDDAGFRPLRGLDNFYTARANSWMKFMRDGIASAAAVMRKDERRRRNDERSSLTLPRIIHLFEFQT
jgi:hypothetical protein